MKAVFIVFNQANTEKVLFMLDQLQLRGYTFWEQVQGRGSKTGEPRHGTHTWPEMNSAIITMVPEQNVDELMRTIHKLDKRNEELGVRAFVWNVEDFV